MSVVVPLDSIRPNTFNPNEIPAPKLKSLIQELRRRGENIKPIVVREVDGEKIIIDGEQTWQAAKIAGLQNVVIEVVEADDFEARRLCIRANLHGDNNPVKFGKLIAEMLALKDVSNVQLATELGVSEGTIRNRLLYWEAAKKANEDRTLPSVDEIAEMPLKRLRELLGEDGDQPLKPPAGPMEKAKKLVKKMSAEEREAFGQWMTNGGA